MGERESKESSQIRVFRGKICVFECVGGSLVGVFPDTIKSQIDANCPPRPFAQNAGYLSPKIRFCFVFFAIVCI